ncbi:MAG: hypothetical protein ACJ0QO_00195 [Parvicellaceae bacterium]
MKEFNALKWLCLLSFIGFLYCFVLDTRFCLAFAEASLDLDKVEDWLRDLIEYWQENGFAFDEEVKDQLVKFYAIRIVFDVLAMVGVCLMYFKIKLGWTFYLIFQLAYVISPFMLLNFEFEPQWPYLSGFAVFVVPLFSGMIHLIYVLLFLSQKKNLR